MLCWRSYTQNDFLFSIPRYLEDHAERLRAKYLAFVHDLSEIRIDGTRVVDHFGKGDGFSFWWMTRLAEKSPFKSPRIYDCLRLLALEEILLDGIPSDLILKSSDQDLALSIQRLCQNLQIPFAWQHDHESKREWSLRGLFHALPHSVQGLISLARRLVMRWPLRGLRRPRWFSGDNTVFLCSYFVHLDPASCAAGRFHSLQWEALPKHLHDKGWRTNWIHHFLLSSVVPDVRTGLDWVRLFNRDPNRHGCHTFLDSDLTCGIVVGALKDWIWLNVVAWRLRNVQSVFYPKGSAVWLWPMLRREWHTSLNGTVGVSNCLLLALFDAVLKNMPRQKVGLYLCENQAWECGLLRAWRKHGHGEIIGVQHSTAPFWHLYYFDDPRSYRSDQARPKPLPDRLAVNGPVAWKAFAESGYPVEQLVEVEALRYLNCSRVTVEPDGGRARQCPTLEATCASSGVKVLILGELNPVAMRGFLGIVQDAKRLVPSDYKFTFKSHPACAVQLAEYADLQADETREALDRILREFDVVVAANSTSASVDAYLAGLPVIIAVDATALNLSVLRGHPSVCFVSTPKELAVALATELPARAAKPPRSEFFFLNPELPRWERLLSRASEASTDFLGPQ